MPLAFRLGDNLCPVLPVEHIGLNVNGYNADWISLPASKELGKHSSEVPRRGLALRD
jgi:hypothetical protein